jgi:hypothetical protein
MTGWYSHQYKHDRKTKNKKNEIDSHRGGSGSRTMRVNRAHVAGISSMSRTRQSAPWRFKPRDGGQRARLICNRSIESPGVGVPVRRPYGRVGRTWASRPYGRVGLETKKKSCCIRFPWCIYGLFCFFTNIDVYTYKIYCWIGRVRQCIPDIPYTSAPAANQERCPLPVRDGASSARARLLRLTLLNRPKIGISRRHGSHTESPPWHHWAPASCRSSSLQSFIPKTFQSPTWGV